MSEVEDFMNERGGYPTIKFEKPGATLVGDLMNPRVGPVYKFGTQEKEYWPDGTPRHQLVFDCQRDRAESNDIKVGKEDDTDLGTVYAKHRLKVALKEACDEAGCKLSQVGRVKIRRLEDLPPPKPGFNPVQDFKAKVWPSVSTEADDLDGF